MTGFEKHSGQDRKKIGTPGDRWEREADRVAHEVADRATGLDDLRQAMEARTGADLGGVRLHTDTHADGLNRGAGSLAVTSGHDVYFRSGQYSPGTSAGRRLIAHEMTHVAQQSAGGGAPEVQHVRGLDSVRRLFGPSGAGAGTTFTEPPPEVVDQVDGRGVVRAMIDATDLVDTLGTWNESELDRRLAEAARAASVSARGGRQVQLMKDMRVLKQVAGDWKAAYGSRLAADPALLARSQLVDSLQFGAKTAVGQSKAEAAYLKAGRNAGKWRGLTALSDDGIRHAKTAPKNTTHGLTRAEMAAIKIYSANDYKYINPATDTNQTWLESQKPGLTGLGKKAKNKALNLEGSTHAAVAVAGLTKLPPSTVVLWRGMRGTEADMRTLINRDFPFGGKMTTQLLSSTSSRGVARGFMIDGGVDVNKNTAVEIKYEGVTGHDISSFSQYRSEREHLIPPGTQLTMVSLDENTPPPDAAMVALGITRIYRIVVSGGPVLGPPGPPPGP